jgi:hypothetical protein
MEESMTNDWSQQLVAVLQSVHAANADDSTRYFCDAYAGGDSPDAWDCYSSHATEIHRLGTYALLQFPDGSVYVDWVDGIDRFWPSLEMLRERHPDELSELGL